jgi:2-polyprenyl-3-methyl-5-hydroxy-6-metoxy-1,4-benzoquinol methylase
MASVNLNDLPQDYRTRIYESYARNFQDHVQNAGGRFDDRAASRWGAAYAHYFRGWLPARKDAAVVDLACGGGRLLHFFKERGYTRVAGVDISPDQVALARQVVSDVREENVLEFLERHPSEFDVITGLDIVEHFHKDEVLQFLDLCHHALRPGGRLILQTVNSDSPWGGVHRYNDFTHEVGFNPNSLSRLLKLCGFATTETREIGPVMFGYSVVSTLRAFVWQAIRGMLMVWNLAETGHPGSRVFTRILVTSGVKGDAS